MKNNRYFTAIVLCAAAILGSAQDNLTKEITVEKDYVPTESKATKLNTLPTPTKMTVEEKSLNFSDAAIPVSVKGEILPLSPYGYAISHDYSQQRGYVNFGMGSYLNMTGSAGYKILDNGDTKLNIWVQHNSTWGGKNSSPILKTFNTSDQIQKFTNDILGVDFSHNFGRAIFGVNGMYHFSRFNYYAAPSDITETMQNANEAAIGLSIKNIPEEFGMSYFAELDYNLFDNKIGRTQNKFNLKGGIGAASSDYSRFGIDLNFDYLHYSESSESDRPVVFPYDTKAKGFGNVSLSPYFKYSRDRINLKLGINVDIAINDGTNFRISPDVKFDYKFIDGLAFFSSFSGGKSMNSYSEIAPYNRYFDTNHIIGSSFTQLDAVGGFAIGPFSGFSASVWGGYAITKSAAIAEISPYLDLYVTTGIQSIRSYTYATSYNNLDLNGWNMGLSLNYKYKELGEVAIKAQYAPQSYDKGYVLSYDRPEYIIGASVKINPIAKLSFNLDYKLKGNRNMWIKNIIDGSSVPPIYSNDKYDLGNANMLSFGANYKITPQISVFAQLNNILNKQWDEYAGYGAQKFNALGGVSFIF